MVQERWKPVPKFEGRYEVSDLGRVRSLARTARTWYGTRYVHECILKPKISRGGYPEVSLSNGTKNYTYLLVHRLVLIAFGREPEDGEECRHKDNDRRNPAFKNLCWGTHADNMRDQYAHGTRICGETHPRAKLTTELVQWIRESAQSGAEIARVLGVSVSSVCRARTGQTHSIILGG